MKSQRSMYCTVLSVPVLCSSCIVPEPRNCKYMVQKFNCPANFNGFFDAYKNVSGGASGLSGGVSVGDSLGVSLGVGPVAALPPPSHPPPSSLDS